MDCVPGIKLSALGLLLGGGGFLLKARGSTVFSLLRRSRGPKLPGITQSSMSRVAIGVLYLEKIEALLTQENGNWRGVNMTATCCYDQNMAADAEENPVTFKVAEFDEYLLIEGPAGRGPELITEPRCNKERIKTEGSLDSGYDGKQSRTPSPQDVKPNGEETAAELPAQQLEVHACGCLWSPD